MLLNRELPETIGIIVKAVWPHDRTEFAIKAKRAKGFGITEHDSQIISAVVTEIDGRAIAIRKRQYHDERYPLIHFRRDDALWSPYSRNLNVVNNARCIHGLLLV